MRCDANDFNCNCDTDTEINDDEIDQKSLESVCHEKAKGGRRATID